MKQWLSVLDINKAFAKVVGEKVNRGAGYGLECIYQPKPYIDKMKNWYITIDYYFRCVHVVCPQTGGHGACMVQFKGCGFLGVFYLETILY